MDFDSNGPLALRKYGKLQRTSAVFKEADSLKSSVYTLMICNLRQDVACGAVDPSRGLQGLYPDQSAPVSAAVATATLSAHYDHEFAASGRVARHPLALSIGGNSREHVMK
ncbi:hypothetical protein CCR75_002496 [Bremia lactucae]|uniref:Uncharacterized protein n=1 Tax=Bremia lactucae TaxID=4779 RepID=A0A976IH59_BRELC|nr:hypothetical protein CCR75_002496 [Bremia lactucae]